jgi:hypothetical protein
MNTTVMTETNPDVSPSLKARIAGLLYLVTFIAGSLSLVSAGRNVAAGLIAGASYVGVTLLFYDLFKPVSRRVSLIAALFSLMGCAAGVLSAFHLVPPAFNSLVFFGVYCLLIGYLVYQSTYLPRFLGVLMAIGGLGWLTFAWTPLATSLSPFNLVPGIVGEGALTLWLLVMGVNVQRWNERVNH